MYRVSSRHATRYKIKFGEVYRGGAPFIISVFTRHCREREGIREEIDGCNTLETFGRNLNFYFIIAIGKNSPVYQSVVLLFSFSIFLLFVLVDKNERMIESERYR